MKVPTIGAAAARRAVLAAQGFADARPAGPADARSSAEAASSRVSRRHLVRTLDRIRLLQLDSVNVAVRAHYMPLFSRLGPYDRALVDEAAWAHSARRPRLLVEQWAHEASLLPVADWPLLQSGAKRAGWWRHYGPLVERHPELVDDVLAAVKELGPVGAGELERALGGGASVPRPPGASWWDRSDVKRICEYLFGIGELTTGTRRHFQRLYDLPERVLPPAVLAAPPVEPDEAARRLVLGAAAALGVATEPDLRDYYRLSPQRSRVAVAELVEAGELEPVHIPRWPAAYRVPGARVPRRVEGRALLCPFDPLIWERARTERIFGFRYRIEIYVPEAKREYGYYVFPFLLDGALVARVDLKADRAGGVLRVPGAFAEPGVDVARVVAELAAELHVMAAWLGLDGVVAGERGDLAAPLAGACRRAPAASCSPVASSS